MKLSVEKQRGTGFSLVTPCGRRVAVGIPTKQDAELLADGFEIMTSGATSITAQLPGEIKFVTIGGTIK